MDQIVHQYLQVPNVNLKTVQMVAHLMHTELLKTEKRWLRHDSISDSPKRCNMRQIFLIIFIVFSCLPTFGQSKIEGRVIGDESVMLIVTPVDNDSILAFGNVDEDGKFSLTIDDSTFPLLKIIVTGLNIKIMEKIIKNESQTLTFNVTSETKQLKEVIVNAKKIRERGDTINYMASSFIGKNDKVLEDLLRKLPGLTISSDGKISINGQWVKDFYIEGNDMLGDRYNIATTNINAESIASVQILQHHQEAKLLHGKEVEDQPAINIKLKNSAKGVITSNADIKVGGSPFARDVNLNIMRFTPKRQNLSFVKSNNVGNDLRTELHAPTRINSPYGIGLIIPENAPINTSWSYGNNSTTATINQLFKLSDTRMLSCSFNYLYDREHRKSHDYLRYYADHQQDVIYNEQNNFKNRMQHMASYLNYKINSQTLYLKNLLGINLNFNHASGNVLENGASIFQLLKQNEFSISNRLLLNTNAKKMFNQFSSEMKFETSKSDLGFNEIAQIFRAQNFIMNNTLSVFSFPIKLVKFDMKVQGKLEYEHLKTSLPNSMNNMKLFKYEMCLLPRLVYYSPNKINFAIYLPIGMMGYHQKDLLADSKENGQKISFSPYATFSWMPLENWEVISVVSHNRQFGNAMDILPQMYYQNYRNVFNNVWPYRLELNKTLKGNVAVNYKNVLKMFFANIGLTYVNAKNGYLHAYNIENRQLVFHLSPTIGNYRILQLQQQSSKGFYQWNSKISEHLSIGRIRQNYEINDKTYEGRTDFQQAGIDLNARFTKWLEFSSINLYTFNKTYIDHKTSGKSYSTFNSLNSMFIDFTNNLTLNVEGQYYYNNYFRKEKTSLFLNSTLEWKLKAVTLSMECINLLNKNVFHKITDSRVLKSESSLELRGRTFLIGVRFRII